MRGHVEIVNFLLQAGANKNMVNKQNEMAVRSNRSRARLAIAPPK